MQNFLAIVWKDAHSVLTSLRTCSALFGQGKSRDPVDGRRSSLLALEELGMLLLFKRAVWDENVDNDVWISETGTQKLRLVGLNWEEANGVFVFVVMLFMTVFEVDIKFGPSNEFDFWDFDFKNETLQNGW